MKLRYGCPRQGVYSVHSLYSRGEVPVVHAVCGFLFGVVIPPLAPVLAKGDSVPYKLQDGRRELLPLENISQVCRAVAVVDDLKACQLFVDELGGCVVQVATGVEFECPIEKAVLL